MTLRSGVSPVTAVYLVDGLPALIQRHASSPTSLYPNTVPRRFPSAVTLRPFAFKKGNENKELVSEWVSLHQACLPGTSNRGGCFPFSRSDAN